MALERIDYPKGVLRGFGVLTSKASFIAATVLCLSAPLGAPAKTVLEAPAPPPQRLSGTGLYAKGSTTAVRPELIAFSPQYPLWSDGATKRRWIELPPGGFIDASNPDAWEFPPGTRLWKEFSVGRPVETRFIERLADGSWRFAAYVWNDEGTDASLAPAETGVRLPPTKERATRYSVPSESDCRACHEGAAVPVLGFGALQLSPERDPLAPHAEPAKPDTADLRTLVARGVLRNLPKTLIDTPPRIASTSPIERAALGYMHGNCAHCHNDSSEGAGVPIAAKLEQKVSDPKSTRLVLGSLIGSASRFRGTDSVTPTQLIVPGQSHASVLPLRMRSRDPRVQMPPLGTSIPDNEALMVIERWINEKEATDE